MFKAAGTSPSQSQRKEPLPQTRTSNVSKLVTEIGKAYTEQQKYDGYNGNFDQKLNEYKHCVVHVGAWYSELVVNPHS